MGGSARFRPAGEAVREFLASRDKYQVAINAYRQDGNEDAFRAVDAFLEEFDPRKPKEETHRLSQLAEKLHLKP